MLVLIAISIVIYGSKNDIYPLVYVKFSTNVLVIIKVLLNKGRNSES